MLTTRKYLWLAQACISWIRFGIIAERTVDVLDGWCVMEIEYRNRKGVIVGWWAFGSFDPSMPYRGQPAFLKTASA